MNLNMDIGEMLKQKKEIYPTKKYMNLYFKVDRTTAFTTALLYIVFIIVLLLGASKLLIYNKIHELEELQEISESLDMQIADYSKQMKGYNEVLKEFTRYSPTEQEILLVNRMEILNLIDNIIRPVADISEISIEGNQMLVHFSGVTLDETAQIVEVLEESPMVKKTNVDTAFSSEKNRDIVDVSILIEVLKGDEE